MHFSTILIATLAAAVSAGPTMKRQAACPEVDNIPACGYPCIADAVAAVGCAETDYSCMCGNFDTVQSGATSCVLANCDLTNALAVLSAARAVCDACA
ncbi:uncharacterized protein B0T15DRAFT_223147 [Chaetomium strumarium]|uniref:CFEM domain-containing protein n=1 Tax=Chaetomium strumarium TaxID=1170767 RepID=A0AAJ0M2F3_9PEZI|nr:hypothetical protein B0T15DRAFT_223147 [Chaetomium strumarium]